jgi:hypothetical protein
MGRHERNEAIRRPREGLPRRVKRHGRFSRRAKQEVCSLSHLRFARKMRAEFYEASGRFRGSG